MDCGAASSLLEGSKGTLVLEPHLIYRLIDDWQADVGPISHSRSYRLSIAIDLDVVSVDRYGKLFGSNED